MADIWITVALFIVFIPLIIYFGMRTLKSIKMKNVKKEDEPGPEDRAYNALNSTKAIANILRERGYDTSPAESLLARAEEEYNYGNYMAAYSLTMSARRILEKIKELEPDPAKVMAASVTSPTVERELQYLTEGEEEGKSEEGEEEEEYYSTSYLIRQKYPENYLQSKFAISVVAAKIEELEEGRVKEVARIFFQKAQKAFDNEEYTDALKYAIKCRKIIDGEYSVDEALKSEEEGERVVVEEAPMGLKCPNCGVEVEEGDKFCWNCGARISLICPRCGFEARPEDKFCRNCGVRLK